MAGLELRMLYSRRCDGDMRVRDDCACGDCDCSNCSIETSIQNGGIVTKSPTEMKTGFAGCIQNLG